MVLLSVTYEVLPARRLAEEDLVLRSWQGLQVKNQPKSVRDFL
jgi:hypothetical protein